MAEPGAEQDEKRIQQWIDRVRANHRLFKFAPPFACCKCGHWKMSAPEDMGIIRQRDHLLDAFNAHIRFMRAEKKRLKAAAAAKAAA